MKADETANTLGDGGELEHISQKTKYALYGAIALLLLFVVFVNVFKISLPGVEVEKVASITSWYGNATATGHTGFFGSKKKADMSVEIIAVGVLNGEMFNQNDTLTESSIAATRIEVENIGKKSSGEWSFEVEFPTATAFAYTSPLQAPLESGERKTYLLSFDKLKAGIDQAIVVSVKHEEVERSKENNIASKEINIY